MNWQQYLTEWLPFVPAFLLSVSVHESAHALAAKLCGDNTAAKAGRISLYPPRHIDVFGTLILPALSMWLMGVFFGYAKPTPVDPGKLRRPKADFSLVALAGPVSNFALAVLSALAARALLPWQAQISPLLLLCSASIQVNVVLGVINLLPLPGFDGIKALYVLLPDEWCWRLSRADRYSILYLALLSSVGALAWLNVLIELLMHLGSQLAGFSL